jgi:ClpP class serine protease
VRLKGSDDELFSGAFWTAGHAIELGLVDTIGDLRSHLRARYGETVKLKPIAAERGLLGRRLFGAGPQHGPGEEIVAALEARISWSRFGL